MLSIHLGLPRPPEIHYGRGNPTIVNNVCTNVCTPWQLVIRITMYQYIIYTHYNNHVTFHNSIKHITHLQMRIYSHLIDTKYHMKSHNELNKSQYCYQ